MRKNDLNTRRARAFGCALGAICALGAASCARVSGKPASNPASKGAIKIASLAPSCTTILAGLGLAGSIVAVDTWSASIEGIPPDALKLDMMKPDVERLAALESDILFVSTITQEGTSIDPFKPLSDSGTRVVYVPTSESLAGIKADIGRIAAIVGRESEGNALARAMDGEIERIASIARTIPEERRRTVVFEISAAPYIYSFGRGVYLDELLEKAGARNALADETGWIAVSAETVVARNPDVILTNVSYLDDPVAEILARPGWAGITAVREGRVYRIDSDASSQPGPNVARALGEIAKAVYPEYFK